MSQVVKGEMSAKTTYQRSAKGPVSVSECAADGRFITLENTGRKVSRQRTRVRQARSSLRGRAYDVIVRVCV